MRVGVQDDIEVQVRWDVITALNEVSIGVLDNERIHITLAPIELHISSYSVVIEEAKQIMEILHRACIGTHR